MDVNVLEHVRFWRTKNSPVRLQQIDLNLRQLRF